MPQVWVDVADENKVRERAPLAVYPRGVNVLLVRIDGELHAVANKCAHMACPLEGGLLEGYVIACPCHDWRFDVRTGVFVEAPEIALTTYDTKSEEGRVFVALASAES